MNVDPPPEEARLFLTDTLLLEHQKSQPKTGNDAVTDPTGEPQWKLSDTPQARDKLYYSDEIIKPAQLIIPPDELWRTSFTPKGAYIARVSPQSAISPGWKYSTTKKTKDPLSPELLTRLEKLDKQFRNKERLIQILRTACIFGRSLAYKQKDINDRLSPFRIRIVPLREEWISYNPDGTPARFFPLVWKGNGYDQVWLDPKECYLYVWDEDENGNGYQGVSGLLAVYRTILRSENVAEEFSTTIKDRGMGIVDIVDEKAETFQDLVKVRQNFRLGQDRTFVHAPRYKMTVTPGVQSNFNFDTTMERFTKDTSSGSGYPGMAMEGVQSGAVTGSETDQDNRAQKYNELRERADEILPNLHHLEDPSLDTSQYELTWDFEIKLDKGRQAQVKSINAQTLAAAPTLYTVNQALELLELPQKEGSDGDMLYSEWLDVNMVASTRFTKFDIPPKETPDENPDETMDEKVDEKESKDEKLDKKEVAKRLLSQGDSYQRVNQTLRRVFGTGLSNKDIKELKT